MPVTILHVTLPLYSLKGQKNSFYKHVKKQSFLQNKYYIAI